MAAAFVYVRDLQNVKSFEGNFGHFRLPEAPRVGTIRFGVCNLLVLYSDLMHSFHRFGDYCRRSAKLHIFPYPTCIYLQNLESYDITMQVGFCMLVAKTPTYPV